MTQKTILFFFEFLGIISFMLSGSIFAIEKEMDIAGVLLLTAVTGVGGGTIRDLLLNKPIFWMQNNWYIYMALIIGFTSFIFYRLLQQYLKKPLVKKIFDILDTLGLVSFMISGLSIAQIYHQTLLVSIVIGMLTCTGGGVMSD
ncbi:MAG: TRIC cation channel family protein, partial [Legionellaceae bacterium]|nr:TRIC cation channel family protein [Legionellaceae bacterium]